LNASGKPVRVDALLLNSQVEFAGVVAMTEIPCLRRVADSETINKTCLENQFFCIGDFLNYV